MRRITEISGGARAQVDGIRKKYPSYWLAIYANISFEAYRVNLDWVAEIVREALKRKPPTPNVERVWVWSHSRLDLVFSL